VVLERGTGVPSAACERARLREAVLRFGGLLGWQPREVKEFATALTHRTWRRCRRADLVAVLQEYRALAEAIEARAQRRAAGVAGASDAVHP